jgi:hypothetical protein
MLTTQSVLLPGVYSPSSRQSRTLLAVIGSKCIYTDDDVTEIMARWKAGHSLEVSKHRGIAVQTCTVGGFRRVVGNSPSIIFTPVETAYLASMIFPLRSLRRRNKFERALFAPVPVSEINPPPPEPAIVLPIPAAQAAPETPTRSSLIKRLGTKLRKLSRPSRRSTTVTQKLHMARG